MKLVKVIWHDAMDKAGTWVPDSDLDEFANKEEEIVSVGFLVRKTAKYVTLAADWTGPEDDDCEETWGRVTKIPIGMIAKIQDIEGE